MAIPYAQTVESYFYIVMVSVVILLVGFAAGFLIKKLLLRFLKEVELNKAMCKVGITSDLERGVSSIASYLIYLITLILFLDQLGIRSVVVYLFVGGVLMLLILTFLVGMKDIIPNFVGWFYIQKQGRIKEGHNIEIKEISGMVERVGYLETEIKTERGDLLYIPNSLFLQSKHKVKN